MSWSACLRSRPRPVAGTGSDSRPGHRRPASGVRDRERYRPALRRRRSVAPIPQRRRRSRSRTPCRERRSVTAISRPGPAPRPHRPRSGRRSARPFAPSSELPACNAVSPVPGRRGSPSTRWPARRTAVHRATGTIPARAAWRGSRQDEPAGSASRSAGRWRGAPRHSAPAGVGRGRCRSSAEHRWLDETARSPGARRRSGSPGHRHPSASPLRASRSCPCRP